MTGTVGVIVLAGGTSRRLGSDKLAAHLGETTVLDCALAGLPSHWSVVCVGAARQITRSAAWVQEVPPGGGPLAGIAAGVAAVQPVVDLVAVTAGDLPFAGPALVRLVARLVVAEATTAAVVGRDPGGHENPLLAAYRRAALVDRLPAAPSGLPARVLLDLPHLTEPLAPEEALDVDTPADLAAARDRLAK